LSNYSKKDILIVENNEAIFEAYNRQNEIFRYDKETKEKKSLNIYGSSLGLYKNYLYYLSNDSSTIYRYDLNNSNNESILSDLNIIYKFYVTADGLIIIKDEMIEFCYLDGSNRKNIISTPKLTNGNCALADKNNLYYYDGKLNLINLNLSTAQEMDLEMRGGYSVIISDDEKLVMYNGDGTDASFLIFDLNNNKVDSYSIGKKEDNMLENFFYNNGKIYYSLINVDAGDKTTYVYDTQTKSIDSFSSAYRFIEMSFTEDGIIFGKTQEKYAYPDTKGKSNRVEIMKAFMKEQLHKVKYVMIKENQVEILDDATK
jgi:hypothetical protein